MEIREIDNQIVFFGGLIIILMIIGIFLTEQEILLV